MNKLFMILLSLTLIFCFAVGCQDKEAMAELEEFKAQDELEEQNKELVRHYFENLDNGDIEIIKELFSPNIKILSPSDSTEHISFEEAVEITKNVLKAFPDFHHNIEELIAKKDKVVVRLVDQGTHKGEILGIPGTGNKFEFSSIAIFRIEEGKIVEIWEDSDFHGFMQQLGMELKPKEGTK